MILCVIFLWPSKIICSLILMQNMFNVWVVEDKLIKKCVFGRSELNTSVFEKHFISYSCISSIKFNALRSFCNILLCFSKILFPENLGLTLCISIDRIYFLINRKCNENFLIEMHRSKPKFSRKKDFWKSNQNIAETPQSIEFCEQNAWIWDEMLFKITCFEPSFPKIKMFKQFSLNSQASSTFCIKYKEFLNLVGQIKITHNNMYRV